MNETLRFYADLLGLERRDAPPPLTPQTAQWMFDAAGRAIFHINSLDCRRTYDREVTPGDVTGALHHVALRLTGYEEMWPAAVQGGSELDLEWYGASSGRHTYK